ncbi:MAG: hypothetical protein MJ234_06665 [bacterium]|nr:hypothetical protein [bacterium]
MDEYSLLKSKLDADLMMRIGDGGSAPIQVIVQTPDGLKDSDRNLIKSVGGRVKDDLYIINAFSADIPSKGIRKLVLSPRIVRIFNDGQVRSM